MDKDYLALVHQDRAIDDACNKLISQKELEPDEKIRVARLILALVTDRKEMVVQIMERLK